MLSGRLSTLTNDRFCPDLIVSCPFGDCRPLVGDQPLRRDIFASLVGMMLARACMRFERKCLPPSPVSPFRSHPFEGRPPPLCDSTNATQPLTCEKRAVLAANSASASMRMFCRQRSEYTSEQLAQALLTELAPQMRATRTHIKATATAPARVRESARHNIFHRVPPEPRAATRS